MPVDIMGGKRQPAAEVGVRAQSTSTPRYSFSLHSTLHHISSPFSQFGNTRDDGLAHMHAFQLGLLVACRAWFRLRGE